MYWSRGKLSSGAFSNSTGTNGMSVDWAARATPQQTAGRWPGWGVALITAATCYKSNQTVEYTPEECNPAHCDVVGKKTDGVKKSLALAATLIIQPISV